MDSVVLDTSIALQWIVKQHNVKEADELFLAGYSGQVSLHVPALWLWECSNALQKYGQAGWIELSDMAEHLRTLRYPQPMIDNLPDAQRQAEWIELAMQHKLSAYDASYLDLAIRRKAKLATLDRKLRKAAAACQVTCIEI
jgi:predicted nucleic acid-binding protein